MSEKLKSELVSSTFFTQNCG